MPIPVTTNAYTDQKPAEKRRKREYIIVIAGLLSLLATMLTLAGYGVALSITEFGLPHEILFASPLDLLNLSWVVIYLFNHLLEFSFWQLFLDDFKWTLWGIPLLFLAYLGCGLYYKFDLDRRRLAAQLPGWARRLDPRPARTDSVPVMAVKMGIFSTATWLAIPLTYLLFGLVLVVITFTLLTAPLLGQTAAKQHLIKNVVGPSKCASPRTREEWLTPKAGNKHAVEHGANCVLVRNERGLCEQGRVVFATTSAIVLFDPDTGSSYRVPTKDAVIETLASLSGAHVCSRNVQRTGPAAEPFGNPAAPIR